MGETLAELALHITVIGFVFVIIISLRNKIEYSNVYDTFKKSDGLILMFVVYLFVFFAEINISNLNIGVSYPLPSYNNLSGVNWWPFSWISKQLELLDFFNYINSRSNYYVDFATIGILKHFAKFVLHILPISYFTYVLSGKKWLGLIVAEVVGILVEKVVSDNAMKTSVSLCFLNRARCLRARVFTSSGFSPRQHKISPCVVAIVIVDFSSLSLAQSGNIDQIFCIF
jgi:hypothetical protein